MPKVEKKSHKGKQKVIVRVVPVSYGSKSKALPLGIDQGLVNWLPVMKSESSKLRRVDVLHEGGVRSWRNTRYQLSSGSNGPSGLIIIGVGNVRGGRDIKDICCSIKGTNEKTSYNGYRSNALVSRLSRTVSISVPIASEYEELILVQPVDLALCICLGL
jgi:hypothetical protein